MFLESFYAFPNVLLVSFPFFNLKKDPHIWTDVIWLTLYDVIWHTLRSTLRGQDWIPEMDQFLAPKKCWG